MKLYPIVIGLVWIVLLKFAYGLDNGLLRTEARRGRFFPFYTIGRFTNDVCTGTNSMKGTCQVRGECMDGGGITAGSCSSITTQAVCCVYTATCGGSTSNNNTYFYNTNYPGTFNGASRCTLTVIPCDSSICQLRIDFLSFSLAPPNGDGACVTDTLTVTGGSSRVPRICGENTGQHVYVDFNGVNPITITVETSGTVTFNRQWQLQVSQIACASPTRVPSGCLQYYTGDTGTVSSFNYSPAASAQLNTVGVGGTRQLSNTNYGICVRMEAGRCSITWSQLADDPYSFTVTNDVGAVDPSLLGTAAVQSQTCATDYIVIPAPVQDGVTLGSDRFCGLGLVATTSSAKPFVLYTVTDANENGDILNRGFSLSYSQNNCPISMR
ncbi:uncharacterized protein LOC129947103 [Eupeodes corollae]|uniref:uncharacterized protein LOC129947103 n=1 Tax=Eupeodes corollae TaxID=290404 RepID=UPI002493252E|nr:uncharacterized protein LOC129947103 [Eupeodes corollae]